MAGLKLSSKSHSIEELQKKYNNFLAPAFKIVIDGKDLVKSGMAVTNKQSIRPTNLRRTAFQ
jgi:hypothetical protein